MTLHTRVSGAWKQVNGVYVRDTTWKEAYEAWVKDAGVWKQFYQGEIVVTLPAGNITNLNLQSLFTAPEWAGPFWKRVIQLRATNVFGTVPGTPAMRTGTGRGGKLVIENDGYILGAGGLANGGVGGTALLLEQSGVRLSNSYGIYGGGGGGGVGGGGGPGFYDTGYTASEGPYLQAGYAWMQSYYQKDGDDNNPSYHAGGYTWGGVMLRSGDIPASFTNGGYTYYANGYPGTGGAFSMSVTRTYPASTRTYTTGGAGGAGGRGAGNNGENTAGVAGSAGGVNAGAGGTGGGGGGWGANGSAGATGAAGNNGGGSAGGAGGLGGLYVSGNANLESLANTGTLLGRVA